MHASEAGATNHARILSANLLMQKVVPGAVFAICVRVFTSPMHQKATNAGYKLTTDDTSLKKICDQRVVQAECHIVHGIDVLETPGLEAGVQDHHPPVWVQCIQNAHDIEDLPKW